MGLKGQSCSRPLSGRPEGVRRTGVYGAGDQCLIFQFAPDRVQTARRGGWGRVGRVVRGDVQESGRCPEGRDTRQLVITTEVPTSVWDSVRSGTGRSRVLVVVVVNPSRTTQVSCVSGSCSPLRRRGCPRVYLHVYDPRTGPVSCRIHRVGPMCFPRPRTGPVSCRTHRVGPVSFPRPWTAPVFCPCLWTGPVSRSPRTSLSASPTRRTPVFPDAHPQTGSPVPTPALNQGHTHPRPHSIVLRTSVRRGGAVQMWTQTNKYGDVTGRPCSVGDPNVPEGG